MVSGTDWWINQSWNHSIPQQRRCPVDEWRINQSLNFSCHIIIINLRLFLLFAASYHEVPHHKYLASLNCFLCERTWGLQFRREQFEMPFQKPYSPLSNARPDAWWMFIALLQYRRMQLLLYRSHWLPRSLYWLHGRCFARNSSRISCLCIDWV